MSLVLLIQRRFQIRQAKKRSKLEKGVHFDVFHYDSISRYKRFHLQLYLIVVCAFVYRICFCSGCHVLCLYCRATCEFKTGGKRITEIDASSFEMFERCESFNISTRIESMKFYTDVNSIVLWHSTSEYT